MVVLFPRYCASGYPGPHCAPSEAPDILPPGVDPTSFMDRSKHLIDAVLAYKPLKDGPIQQEYRARFVEKLREEDLELEYQGLDQSQDAKTCFLKVHAPWETLARVAEINRIKFPIQISDIGGDESRSGDDIPMDAVQEFLCCGRTPFLMEEDLRTPDTPTYFTLKFQTDQTQYFLNQDRNTFFTQHMRIQLLWDVLQERTKLREVFDKKRV